MKISAPPLNKKPIRSPFSICLFYLIMPCGSTGEMPSAFRGRMSACGPEALLFPDGEALAFSPVIWKKASILL